MKKISAISLLFVTVLFSCNLNNNSKLLYQVDVQGHRGARTIFPENTIAGFIYALEQGVTTLEMDVVITRDNQVILSHEPFMSHEICLDTNNTEIAEADEKQHNIYQLTFSQIQQYDCGSKVHPRFPFQNKLTTHKPLISEVIDEVEKYLEVHNLPKVQYNIETKTSPEGDNLFHPKPNVFVDLLLKEIIKKKIQSRTIIQSFDVRTLQYLNKINPKIKTALLVENNLQAKDNLSLLGFTPTIYSPNYKLINKELKQFCVEKNMQLIAWTVNDTIETKRLIELQVNGIISDNPKMIIDYLKQKHINLTKP